MRKNLERERESLKSRQGISIIYIINFQSAQYITLL